MTTDKQLIAERFAKAIDTYPQEAGVQRQIAAKMTRLLKAHIPLPCPRIVEFGCGTGTYSRMLLDELHPQELLLNDLCPQMSRCFDSLPADAPVSFLPGDAESADFPSGRTLITSCSALQWFESPENFFGRCHRLLGRNGHLAFSTFGKENLREIRRLTGNGLRYRSLGELTEALSAHFDILHAEEEQILLWFDHPTKVLYHLKQTGVTGVAGTSAGQLRTRRDLQAFGTRYTQQFAKDTSVPLTYHPIYIIAKKKET